MTPQHSSGLRVGDAERDEARRLLNEHLAAGRLTPEEFGDRAARAAQGRTRGELMSLFTDLPAPAPDFDAMAGSAPGKPRRDVGTTTAAVVPRRPDRAPMPKYVKYLGIAVVTPFAATGAVAGIVATTVVPLVLLVAVLTVAGLFGGLCAMDYFLGWSDDGRQRR